MKSIVFLRFFSNGLEGRHDCISLSLSLSRSPKKVQHKVNSCELVSQDGKSQTHTAEKSKQNKLYFNNTALLHKASLSLFCDQQISLFTSYIWHFRFMPAICIHFSIQQHMYVYICKHNFQLARSYHCHKFHSRKYLELHTYERVCMYIYVDKWELIFWSNARKKMRHTRPTLPHAVWQLKEIAKRPRTFFLRMWHDSKGKEMHEWKYKCIYTHIRMHLTDIAVYYIYA